MAPRILVFVACILLLASSAVAEWDIVVDFDSNATNGPDTLDVASGDTVLARVWIADSTDSLFGFGITIGDTSGVLAWVEDSASAIFVLPEEWTRFSVLKDEQGFLLLQPYDFSFSAPLHLPSEVARLRFVAVEEGACATFAWDSTMCGWQNTEFEEGTFGGFEGTTVCVRGGGDEAEDGSSGGDEGADGGAAPPESQGGDEPQVPAYLSDGITFYPREKSNALNGLAIVQFREGYFAIPSNRDKCMLEEASIADDSIAHVLSRAGVVEIERVDPSVRPENPVLYAKSGRRFDLTELTRTYVIRGSRSSSARNLLHALSAVAYAYDYAEPCYPIERFDFPEPPTTLPGDSIFVLNLETQPRQPHLLESSGYGLNMGAVWPITTGSPRVHLGIFDVGVDSSLHPDLTVRDEQGDPVGSRYIYRNVCNKDTATTAGHGQVVLGIAAALTHNRKPTSDIYEGIAGIAGGAGGACADTGCGVTVTFYDHLGCEDSVVAPGDTLKWMPVAYVRMLHMAIRDGVDIVSMSSGVTPIGGPWMPDTMDVVTVSKALVRAYKSGMTLVAAAGNQGSSGPRLIQIPADAQTNRMLVVGSGRVTGASHEITSIGNNLDCLAAVTTDAEDSTMFALGPNGSYARIREMWPTGGYGTSWAAPQVSGVAALLMSAVRLHYPARSLVHEEVEALIKAGAERCTDYSDVPNENCGYGFARADRSVAFTQPPWYWERKCATGRDFVDGSALAETVIVWDDDGAETLMPEGRYVGKPYTVYLTIEDPHLGSESMPVVAGIGEGAPGSSCYTSGWANPARMNAVEALYQDYCCEVDSVWPYGFRLKTTLWEFTGIFRQGALVDTCFWMPRDTLSENNWYYGIFYEVDSATATAIEDGETPVGSGLGPRILRVTPNPANPTVGITLQLSHPLPVSVEVVDVSGRVVRALTRETLQAGQPFLVWDGRDAGGIPVGSGVYFVRAAGGGKADVRKIVVLH